MPTMSSFPTFKMHGYMWSWNNGLPIFFMTIIRIFLLTQHKLPVNCYLKNNVYVDSLLCNWIPCSVFHRVAFEDISTLQSHCHSSLRLCLILHSFTLLTQLSSFSCDTTSFPWRKIWCVHAKWGSGETPVSM